MFKPDKINLDCSNEERFLQTMTKSDSQKCKIGPHKIDRERPREHQTKNKRNDNTGYAAEINRKNKHSFRGDS